MSATSASSQGTHISKPAHCKCQCISCILSGNSLLSCSMRWAGGRFHGVQMPNPVAQQRRADDSRTVAPGAMGNSSSSTYSDEQLVESLENGSVSLFLSAVQANRKVVARPIRARNGDTGLHIICTKGLEDGLRAVLQAVLELRSAEKGAPLTPDEVRKFSAKVCNVTNERGRTPLMAAAKTGHVNCARILLENHANVWIRDRAGGATVMHYAAAAGHDAVVTLLKEYCQQHPAPSSVHAPRNGLLDMPNDSGLTPLHYAVWHKRHRTVTVLCELGASLYSISMWSTGGEAVPCAAGSTPLHVAAVSGSGRCTKALMKAYAAHQAAQEEEARANGGIPITEPMIDPRLVQDRQGNLPFAIALQYQHVRLLPYLHPFTPLADMFVDERPEDRVVGVPKLTELSALVAQRVLLEQLDAIEAEVAAKAAKPAEEQQPQDGASSSTAAGSPSTDPSSPASMNTVPEQPAPTPVAGADAITSAVSEQAAAIQADGSIMAMAAQPEGPVIAAAVANAAGAGLGVLGGGTLLPAEEEASRVVTAAKQPGAQSSVTAANQNGVSSSGAEATQSASPPSQPFAKLSVPEEAVPIQGTYSSISIAADTPAGTPAAPSAIKRTAADENGGTNQVEADSTQQPDGVVASARVVSDDGGDTDGSHGSQQGMDSARTRVSAFAVSPPSWVERHGMWRSKLHETSDTHDDSIQSPLQQDRSNRSSDSSGQHSRSLRRARSDCVGPQPLQVEGEGGAKGHWMARRNAWRETLKRHGDQLLAAAKGTFLPGADAALQGASSHHPATFFASTQTLAELRGLAWKANQQAAQEQSTQEQQQQTHGTPSQADEAHQHHEAHGAHGAHEAHEHHEAHGAHQHHEAHGAHQHHEAHGAHEHHEAHHHVPPTVALNLRLLGLAGSVGHGWPTAAELTSPQPDAAASQLSRRVSADGIVWHNDDDDRGQRSSRPSQTQLRAAIHMVRMHRLTNGVSDLYTPVHLESDIPEGEEEGEQAGEAAAGPGSDHLDINTAPGEDGLSLLRRSRSPEITISLPPEDTEELADLLTRASAAAGSPEAAGNLDASPRSPFGMAAVQEQQEAVTSALAMGTDAGVARSEVDRSSPSLGRARSITNAVLARQWVKQASGGLTASGGTGNAGTGAGATPAGVQQNVSVQLGTSRKSICVAAVLTGATAGPTAGLQLSHSMLRGGPRQPGMLSNANSLTHNSQLLALLSRCSSMSDACSEDVCGVCLDAGTFVNLKGCTHRICVGCAKELVRLHDLKPAFCPFCRHFILGFSLYSPTPPHTRASKAQGNKAKV